MDLYIFIVMPVIGAIIGWITNWTAVKLLFRPYRPISMLGYKLQGLIPKRQQDLAKSIGEVVEKELISVDDLLETIRSDELLNKVSIAAADSIRTKIIEKFPIFVPLSIKRAVSDIITDQIRMEIPNVINETLDSFGIAIKEKVSFQEIIRQKVSNFPLDHLEKMVFAVSARELRHIEFLGGVLGFIIGLVQAVLIFLVI